MKNKFETPQEVFWSGSFGDEYVDRNKGDAEIAAAIDFFARALGSRRIESCVELGANVGMNLLALRRLQPWVHLSGVEINAKAAAELRPQIDHVDECSIFDWTPEKQADLSLIKTVLIHINPDKLNDVYDRLYSASRKWILICEYYNPSPVEVTYRGHQDRLFKRDFAGEMLDRYPDLNLIDYGFMYRRDPVYLHDDQSWFLLEKA